MELCKLKDYLKEDFWIMPATPKYKDSGIPYITSKNIKNGKIDFSNVNYISEEDYNSISKNRPIKKGDILISMIGTLGETAIVSDEDVHFYGQNMFLVRLDEDKMDKDFFSHFFKSIFVKQQLDRSKNKSTQGYLKANHIEDIVTPNIDLNTQKTISKKLNIIDKLINDKENQIALLNSLIKSQFVEMFEKEKRYVNLEDVCIFINGDRGKNYPSADKISKDANGVPFINAGLLINNGVDWENMNYISEETYNKLGSGKIQKDDILYCLRGSLGKHAIIDFDSKGAIASSLVILRADQSKIQPNFLLIQLGMDEILRQQIQANNGSSQPNLSASSVKKYKIKLPDIESQSKFVNIVKQIDKQKFVCEEQLKKLEKLQASLMQEYFG